MKKLLFSAVLLTASLFSCGKKSKNPEEYVRTENFTVYTSTAAPQTVTQSLTEAFTVPTEATKFSYALNGTSVELHIDGVLVKRLDYYYTPDEKSIIVADFNFDGYDDIFIPYENFYSGYGYYYCYDPNKNDFVDNDELDNINRAMTVTGENTLTENRNDGYTDTYIDYQWVGGKLKAVKRTDTYKAYSDGKIHTDIYNYDAKGNEILVDTVITEDSSENEENTLPQ